jgi:hypothetical protein
LLLVAGVLATPRRAPAAVVTAVVVAILLGVGTEATVFRLAIFDPVDLSVQSLGAVLVGCSLLDTQGSLRLAVVLVPLGILLLVMGFFYAFA